METDLSSWHSDDIDAVMTLSEGRYDWEQQRCSVKGST